MTSAPPIAPSVPIPFEVWVRENCGDELRAYDVQRAREVQWQEEAFAGQCHTVCGLLLRGMTGYDMALLHGCGNPFIAGGRITSESIAQFLAVLVELAPRGWLSRRRFFRSISRYPFAKAVEEINAFVDRMLAHSSMTREKPKADGSPRSSNESSGISLHFLAPLVIEIAGATGWSEEEILGMRLDKLFQYEKAIELRRPDRLPHSSKSDALVARCLARYNEYQAALKAAGS